MPHIDMLAAQLRGSRLSARMRLRAADANIRPAHAKPNTWTTSGTTWIAAGGR
jgi:hypothetical protein